MTYRVKTIFSISLIFLGMFSSAYAGIDGRYTRSNMGQTSTLLVFNCGGGKGIKVEKSTHKPAVGKVIMCGAKKNKNGWSGKILNLEDGKRYNATISNSGSRLKIRGCILGGTLCQNQFINRAK